MSNCVAPYFGKSRPSHSYLFVRYAGRVKRFAAVILVCAVAFAASEPWTSADVIAPADFAREIVKPSHAPVYYVGFNVLYRSKHMPGAIYAGPGAEAKGLDLLKSELAKVPRDREIILYCGCCPIDKCPNLRPAFQAARDMGFKKVKLVMLPTSFGIDWVEKGYPFESGQ
jgi:hypothetical protein